MGRSCKKVSHRHDGVALLFPVTDADWCNTASTLCSVYTEEVSLQTSRGPCERSAPSMRHGKVAGVPHAPLPFNQWDIVPRREEGDMDRWAPQRWSIIWSHVQNSVSWPTYTILASLQGHCSGIIIVDSPTGTVYVSKAMLYFVANQLFAVYNTIWASKYHHTVLVFSCTPTFMVTFRS
jgi:hypothetical protein